MSETKSIPPEVLAYELKVQMVVVNIMIRNKGDSDVVKVNGHGLLYGEGFSARFNIPTQMLGHGMTLRIDGAKAFGDRSDEERRAMALAIKEQCYLVIFGQMASAMDLARQASADRALPLLPSDPNAICLPGPSISPSALP